MADNVDAKTASNVPVAADEVTYSGDAGQKVQLMRMVQVTGAEGAKTVVDLPGDATDGLLVNLGTNNDVTVTGTVTANLAAGNNNIGDVDIASIAAGDNNIGNVDVVTLPSLVAGTAYIGKVRQTDGTNDISLSTSFADATSNTTTALPTRSFSMAFNGTTWDRLRLSSAFADGESNSQIALLTESYNIVYNGTTWDRMRGDATNGVDVDVTRIAAGTNAIGNVGIIPRTTGGLTTYHLVSANTTNATVIKASAGQLFGWYIYNNNSSMRKLAFHNTASTPTAGASIFFTINVPGSSAANVFLDAGIAFSTGIAITTVTDVTDAGTTAVGTSDLTINLFYA